MDPFIGQIKLFPYNYEPMYWAFCAGQILQIQQYSALFALIGNKFGGDGKTTFALPDLRGAEPQAGSHYFIALYGLFPIRS